MPKVKNGPKELNAILENVFDSCTKSGGDEIKASREAWGAAKKAGWKKNIKGEWVNKTLTLKAKPKDLGIDNTSADAEKAAEETPEEEATETTAEEAAEEAMEVDANLSGFTYQPFDKDFNWMKPHMESTYNLAPTDLDDAKAFMQKNMPQAVYAVPMGKRALLEKKGDKVQLRMFEQLGHNQPEDHLVNSAMNINQDFIFDGWSDGLQFTAHDAPYLGKDISKEDYLQRRHELDKALEQANSPFLKAVPVKYALDSEDIDKVLTFAKAFPSDQIMMRKAFGPYVADDPGAWLTHKGYPLELMVGDRNEDGSYPLFAVGSGAMDDSDVEDVNENTDQNHPIGVAQYDKELKKGAIVRVGAAKYDPSHNSFGSMKIMGMGQSAMSRQQVFEKLNLKHSSELLKSLNTAFYAVRAIVEDTDDSFQVPILKADSEQQLVFGVVLEPDSTDLQGDVISEEDVEKTAHDYVQESRVIGLGHAGTAQAALVESYIARKDFALNGQTVKKGSWVIGVHVEDSDTWQKIKNGEIQSFSIGGFGLRQPLE